MSETSRRAGGTKTELIELVGLLKTYTIQETAEPLKRIGRTLAFGSASAVLLGIAAVLSLIAVLRALQEETGTLFAGEWNWAPYLLTAIAGMIFLGVAAVVGLRRRSERP